MQRTGTRERACRSGAVKIPLVEHAQHAPQPRSIAWEGGGEAAMKGGTAHLACRELRELLDFGAVYGVGGGALDAKTFFRFRNILMNTRSAPA